MGWDVVEFDELLRKVNMFDNFPDLDLPEKKS